MDARSAGWWFAAVAVSSAAVYTVWHGFQRLPDASPLQAHAAASPAPALFAPAGDAATAALPPTLQGTNAPRLPLDSRGGLARERAVRDFFDYFLTAQGQTSEPGLDALVEGTIRAQVGGKPAEAEATQLWQRYRAYLAALDKPPGGDTQPATAPEAIDFDAIARMLDQRAQLAQQHLGPWADLFFGDESREQRYAMARARILGDASLSAADKESRLHALEQSLPADQREALQRERREDAARQDMQKVLAQGGSPEQMRAAAAQFGPEAAERAAQIAGQERDWHHRYADYAAQRKQIDAQGLAPDDRQRQLTMLRQQFFPNPADARRAGAFDGE